MENLNLIKTPGLFIVKGGSPLKGYKGVTVDLTDINPKSAEALANDPDCKFIEWKDDTKRAAVEKLRAAKIAAKTTVNEVAKRMADAQGVQTSAPATAAEKK